MPLRRIYALSARVLSIGYPVLAALPEREIARAHVKKLADETGGSVCLAIIDSLRRLAFTGYRGHRPARFRGRIRRSFPNRSGLRPHRGRRRVVTDWQRRPLGLHSEGRVVVMATPGLHKEALAVLQDAQSAHAAGVP